MRWLTRLPSSAANKCKAMDETAPPSQKVRFKFHSIQTKVTLAIVFVLIPVVTLLSLLSFRNAQTLLRERINEQVETVITARQDRINDWVGRTIELSKMLASDAAEQTGLINDDPQTRQVEASASGLEDVRSLHPEILDIGFVGTEATSAAAKTSGLYEEDGAFYVSAPVKGSEEIVGTVVAQIMADDLFRILRDYSGLGTTGEIILAKHEGDEVVFLNSPRNMPTSSRFRLSVKENPRDPIVLAALRLTGPNITADYRGIEVVASYRHFPLTGWGLVVKIDSDEAFAPIERLKTELIQVSLLTFVLFLLVAFVVSRSITTPLQRLKVGTEKIGKGEWDYDLDIHSGDEVERLAADFTDMARELKGLYGGLEQKVRDRTSELEKEKQVSEQLAEDLKKFKLAVENVSDQIIITDPDGHIIYANEVIEKNTGYAREEVMGKTPGELWGGETDNTFYGNMWKMMKEEKKIWTGEVTNKRKNGETYIGALSVAPIMDQAGEVRFFVGIERDVTLEKEVDRMKTEFISVASHQLRTPLSAIKWFTEMLLSEDAGKLTSEQRKFLQQVYGSNERMIELVNALLNVSRIEQGRITIDPKPTDLVSLVNEVLAELEPKIKQKKLKVIMSKHEKLPNISIDPKLIRQAYANLISNAVKYTPEKGEIVILISKKGKEIISQIQDTGYGIPKSDHSRVFSKFFRADNILKVSAEGTGLGLYIVKSVVESSGGKIWFESEEGKGSAFMFTLPVAGTRPQKGERTLEEARL